MRPAVEEKLKFDLNGIRKTIIMELNLKDNAKALPKEVNVQVDHFDVNRHHICETKVFITFPTYNTAQGMVMMNYDLDYPEDTGKLEGFMNLDIPVITENYTKDDFLWATTLERHMQEFLRRCYVIKNSQELYSGTDFGAIQYVTCDAQDSRTSKETLVNMFFDRVIEMVK